MQNDSLAYKFLQDDANRFFPFSVKVEDKEVSCYILKRALGFAAIKSVSKEKIFEFTDSIYTQKNMPLLYIIESLNGIALFDKSPVVDETNYTENVDLHLTNAFINIETLRNQLLQNGFLLEEGKRKIRMLVIDDK